MNATRLPNWNKLCSLNNFIGPSIQSHLPVGGQDNCPTVEGDHSHHHIHHKTDSPRYRVEEEESYHHHHSSCTRHNYVDHGEDQERDHQASALTLHPEHHEEAEESSDAWVDSAREHKRREEFFQVGHDHIVLVHRPHVAFQGVANHHVQHPVVLLDGDEWREVSHCVQTQKWANLYEAQSRHISLYEEAHQWDGGQNGQQEIQ